MAKIKVDEANVTTTLNDVQVDATVPNADIITKQSITAEVEPDNYILASQGYSAGVPEWVSSKVSEIIKNSIGTGGTLADALDKIKTDLMDEIQLGVNQAISEVKNAYVSKSALTTTLASEIGASRAAILKDVQTYADSTQSIAADVNALKASFGNDISANAINAFIENVALTKATSKEAFASTVNTLTTQFNGQQATIEDIQNVTVDANGYSLGASKLGTAPDGSIVGWQFTDGTGVQSEFKINAQKFSISDGNNSATPFSIDTTGSTPQVKFNGVVSFSNVTGTDNLALKDMSNVTTIDGGKITTGTIDANLVNVTNINASNIKAGAIYNTGGSASNYTMKIDLDNGELHIL